MIGIFLDTETNGLDPQKHLPIEIAFQLIDLKTGKLLDQYASIIAIPLDKWDQSNKKSLEINGFTLDLMQKGKPLDLVKTEILEIFKHHHLEEKKAVFICQNPSFDRVFFAKIIDTDTQNALDWPYHWLDLASMYWGISLQKSPIVLPWETGFSKDQIAKFNHIPEEDKPHRALNGVKHLALCYKKIIGFPNNN